MSVDRIEVPAAKDVMAALQDNRPKSDQGHTAFELAEEWGVSRRTAQIMIQKAVSRGMATSGWRYGVNIAGRSYATPVYRFDITARKAK